MCKKHLLTAFLFCLTLSAYTQAIYRPGTHVVVNDAVAPTPAVPLDARTMKYDSINFLYRAYNGTAEVLSYLNTSNYRSGNFILVVDSGGSLQSNGTYIGGYNTFWMFKDSTTAGGLVKMNLFGMGAGVCASCLQAANNLSDLASLSTALINLGLNNVNNTSDATKNAASVTLTNHTISGNNNTLTNIPNLALTNSAIGLTLTANSASDISVTTTPAALGTSLVANFPSAGTASRGPLTAANWNFFDGKLDSVHVSNDSVYNCVNGTCTLQSVISGTGGVSSVNGTNASLLFSPTTGNALGQVNPAFGFNWSGQHTFLSFAPIFSTLTTAGGLFYGDGFGQLLQSAAGTTAQILESQGGSAPVFFTPLPAPVEGWLGFTPLSAALGSTQIYVGNSLNTAAAVNMSGDVHIDNTGATTVQPNTISNSKLAQMPGNTLKGNNTGSTANAADLTAAQVNTMLGLPALTTYSYLGRLLGSDTILQYSVINMLDIGLVADSSTDNTPILRAWIAAHPGFSGSWYFPGVGKGYYFSDSVSITLNVNIYGDGAASYPFYTIINVPHKGATNIYCGSATANLFPIHASATNKNPYVLVHDLTFKNVASGTPSAGSAISINDGVAHTHIFRCLVDSFYNNIQVNSGSFVLIEGNDILAPVSVGIFLANSGQPDGGGFIVDHNNIISGVRSSSTAKGIYVQSGGGMSIHDNFFNAQQPLSNPTAQFAYPIYMDFAGGATSDITIHHNFFENYQLIGLYMINRSGGTLFNVKITDNEFSPYNNPFHPAIFINHYQDVNLNGNFGVGYGSASTETFIRLDSTQAIISPGTFGNGWISYDSADAASSIQNTMMDPYTNTINGGWFNVINNGSAGTASFAGTQWKAGSGTGGFILYRAPSWSPAFLAGSLGLSNPNGDIDLFGTAQIASFKNNGHVLFSTTTDLGSTFNLNGGMIMNKDSAVTSAAASVVAVGIDTITGRIVKSYGPPIRYAHTIFTPTTGGTVNLVNNQYNIINPAGALLALTLNLPSAPANNDVVYIKFTQNITTVTYANGTVVDGITAPTAGGLTVLVFDAGTSSWY